MIRYIIRRLLITIPVLFGISVITFLLVRLIPGDTVTVLLGNRYNEQLAAEMMERYGLDKPLYVQYGIWISDVLRGDFGKSSFSGDPVLTSILERLPVTLELAVISVLFAVVIGIPLGVWAAYRRNSPPDYAATFLGLLGISVPGFWLGTLLVLFFSLKLGWFPSGGFTPLWQDPLDNLRRMAMPGVALGAAVSAVVMRMTRSTVLEVLDQDYMKMARAKGVPARLLVIRHALKNAMIPIITVLGIQIGYLIGGSVVIEQIFSLPGVGRLALQSITNRDYTLMQGTILFVAFCFVLINFVVDLIYALLNPRIRY
ncbi:ABC transporter permease [Paenibacillus beijingensis]|uniref:Glutathione ABC transporter permease n=1 Tax=Paenibacillus beijingensis TaxID=1126833 RepID=A0A0D5NH20_9BACL|nr:ABC transporter permease [Paenibacillus beijingensis]AJY74252.1 glutathione ABC transporter permease [Paenibacillus beijingensis]